jgi:hypothetical protein
MAVTPADEYLIHQTPYTFDRVATSDRNFMTATSSTATAAIW